MRSEVLLGLLLCVFLFSMPARRQARLPCVGEACGVVQIRVSDENCYFNPAENPGFKVYIDNSDSTRRVHVRVKQHGTSLGFPPVDMLVDQDAPARGSGPVGCTQYFSHVPPPDHIVVYTYTVDTAVFVTENVPGPTTSSPPTHHRLSDAECRTSNSPPDLPASGHGVYILRLAAPAPHDNDCLGFEPGNPEDVRIANCRVEQKKLFTLIPAGNGCYIVRNGNMIVPPASGRCLEVKTEDSEELRAKACAPTDQQFWKLFRNPADGTYNLINQRSGKCLDRDSGGDKNAHMVDCDGSQWQRWRLRFIREN